jgi:hypothetical protein
MTTADESEAAVEQLNVHLYRCDSPRPSPPVSGQPFCKRPRDPCQRERDRKFHSARLQRTEPKGLFNKAVIVWIARNNASLLPFGLAVHLRPVSRLPPAASNARVRASAIDDHTVQGLLNLRHRCCGTACRIIPASWVPSVR